MAKRTDIHTIRGDLAAAIARRNEATQNIKEFEAELRDAEKIAKQLEESPAQRFQKQRDATVNPLDAVK